MDVPHAAKGATRSRVSIRLSIGVNGSDGPDDEGSTSQMTVSPVATHASCDAFATLMFVSLLDEDLAHVHVMDLHVVDGDESLWPLRGRC